MAFLDSKFGAGLLCAAGAAAGVIGVAWLRDSGEAPAQTAPPARVASWDGPLGPGALARPAPDGDAFAPAQQPLTDAAGRLLVDPALHRIYDTYLKSGSGAGAPREQELHAWLKRRLTGPALAQAENLAGDYLRYLQAEAALRANERLTAPDPVGLSAAQTGQMLAWQQERARLRERMLGAAVTQAWFGSDDAECTTALNDWRLMQTPAGSEEVGSNELRERRLRGAMLEQRRNQRAQSCAAQLMDRLAADGPVA